MLPSYRCGPRFLRNLVQNSFLEVVRRRRERREQEVTQPLILCVLRVTQMSHPLQRDESEQRRRNKVAVHSCGQDRHKKHRE